MPPSASLVPRSLLLVAAALSGACASHAGIREAPAPAGVTAADIERNPSESLERLLQVSDPSLQITSTPGGVSVTIRGASSFVSGTEPLYVLDGTPLPYQPGGLLSGLNPYDVESIRVLKNPADIAIYGVRGGNGVIVITTKRPGRRDPGA